MPLGSKIIALLSASFPLRPFNVLLLGRYSRHPFAAFSSAAVFHGRLHSVSNRPKLWFWSGAANKFHSEAFINEVCGEAATSFSDSKSLHPWPEWSKLADLLVEKGYLASCITSGDDDDSFLVDEDLPEGFLKAAEACLGFARDRPDILRLLAKKNIEAVVLNGSPFLFKNGDNSARRMKLFLTGMGNNELELDKAQTIDIMRYLLSYVYGPLSSSAGSNFKSDELVERSVRKLLCELFNLSGTFWKPNSVDATLVELPLSNEQIPKFPGRSSSASENLTNASINYTDKEHGNIIFNQKQGPVETPTSQTRDRSMPNDHFITNSAQPSTSAESYNTVQSSNTSPTQPPSHLGNNYNTYYGGYTGKPILPSSNPWSNNAYDANSTQKSWNSASNSWNNYNTSFTGYNVNSTQPSSTFWNNGNTPYGGSTVNSSQPLPPCNTANSTQPSSNSWSNNNRSYGEFTPNTTRHDGYSNTSSYSSQPPSNSWNAHNTSSGGFEEKLKQPSFNSYSASTAYSPQPPNNSWNNYSQPYSENVMKSTQPSNTSFDGHTMNSSQPHGNSWSNHNTNAANSTAPSTSSRISDNSYVGFNADSYRGYPANSNQSSSYYSSNNSREVAQTSNGLPFHGQTQNSGANVNYGYSGKSLEGSCVKEPDPLDMSEEAKAERWFRRAAQIKDISELSQIPDEDFPQIMPMRKGVNRFVVSKRKTPLERRLASQQYKRSLPVVSSEPEKEPTDGEKEI